MPYADLTLCSKAGVILTPVQDSGHVRSFSDFSVISMDFDIQMQNLHSHFTYAWSSLVLASVTGLFGWFCPIICAFEGFFVSVVLGRVTSLSILPSFCCAIGLSPKRLSSNCPSSAVSHWWPLTSVICLPPRTSWTLLNSQSFSTTKALF